MALSTTSDYQIRIKELMWYIEQTTGKSFGNLNQDGTTQISPEIQDLVRVIDYASASDETTAYTDYKTLIWSYITYRNARLGLSGGPGV